MEKKLVPTIAVTLLASVLAGALVFALDAVRLRSLSPLEFVVDQKGGGTFTSIQQGIDSGVVSPGDILKVWWGLGYQPYTGANVSKSVTVKSDVMHNGVVKPIVDGGGKGAVFNVTAENAAIFNFTIQNGKYGINIFPTATNTTVAENLIKNNAVSGILISSENNTIKGNTLTTNNFGMRVRSSGNLLKNNNMTNNTYNFGISNFVRNDVDTSNKVNRKPVYVWINEHHRQVPPDAGYVAVVDSSYIAVKNLILSNNDYGIQFVNTSSSNIENVEVSNNNLDGIYLYKGITNRIENVNASYNSIGISLEKSNSSQIMGNIVSNNWAVGIDSFNSRENTIIENTIKDNYAGIQDINGLANRFYHNNIKANHMFNPQAVLSNSLEFWDNGAEGNYWSDYLVQNPGAKDLNGDGIWDFPYRIDTWNADWYPLVNPWKSVRLFNVAKTAHFKGYNITIKSDHVIASASLNFTRIGTDVYPRQLSFNITAGSSGFVNVTIPRAWLDGPFTLWTNDIPRSFNQIVQNPTHSSLYFTYSAGKYRVKILGEKSGAIEGDLNGDGKIDIRDIALVAIKFGDILPPNLTPNDITKYDP